MSQHVCRGVDPAASDLDMFKTSGRQIYSRESVVLILISLSLYLICNPWTQNMSSFFFLFYELLVRCSLSHKQSSVKLRLKISFCFCNFESALYWMHVAHQRQNTCMKYFANRQNHRYGLSRSPTFYDRGDKNEQFQFSFLTASIYNFYSNHCKSVIQ